MLAIQNLPIAAKVRLMADGVEAEVVDNPGDGTWLLIRRLEPGAKEELCHVDELLEVV
jgi:hypothetical protein